MSKLAPFLAQRPVSGQPPPLPSGGETIQYQVPHELLVLARNREKDKARSVAATPVAPRPSPEGPPPSPPAVDAEHAESSAAGEDQPSGAHSAIRAKSRSVARLALLLAAALWLVAGYCAVELLRLH